MCFSPSTTSWFHTTTNFQFYSALVCLPFMCAELFCSMFARLLIASSRTNTTNHIKTARRIEVKIDSGKGKTVALNFIFHTLLSNAISKFNICFGKCCVRVKDERKGRNKQTDACLYIRNRRFLFYGCIKSGLKALVRRPRFRRLSPVIIPTVHAFARPPTTTTTSKLWLSSFILLHVYAVWKGTTEQEEKPARKIEDKVAWSDVLK